MLECVDALDPGQSRPARTYYATDNHWTPVAHAPAADLVARRLADRALANVRIGSAR